MPMPYRDTGWYESMFGGGQERRVSFQMKNGKMTRLEASISKRYLASRRAKPWSWHVYVGSWVGREVLFKRGLASSESAAKILANRETRKAIRKLARR